MRKGALLLALMMVAAAPTAALAAKKKAPPKDPNWAGQKLANDAAMQPYHAWQSVVNPKPAKAKKK